MLSQFKNLCRYYRSYRGEFLRVLACALLVSGINLIIPLGIRRLAEMGSENLTNELVSLALGLTLLAIVRLLTD